MTTAIILAAGRGSRLGAVTSNRPKCLTTLAGRTLLDWQIAALRKAGIDDVVLVAGYRDNLLRDRTSATVVVNTNWQSSGPVASLLCAEPHQLAGDFLVVYGDCVFDAAIFSTLLDCRADIAIATDEQWKALWAARFADIYTDAERFRHDANRLIEISGRATAEDDVQGQFMGLLKFNASGWRQVCDVIRDVDAEQTRTMDMTTLLALLLSRGVSVTTVPVQGGWCEIDSETDLAIYRKRLRRRSWSHDWRRGIVGP